MHLNDFAPLKMALEEYGKKYSGSFTSIEKDLFEELGYKINILEDIIQEIIDLISQLFPPDLLSPDENGIVDFGFCKIKFERADPDTPIKRGNIAHAFVKASSGLEGENNNIEFEKVLERRAYEYYQNAHRICDIIQKLPHLDTFECRPIRIVRNHLIEHPEKHKGVTIQSFAYSLNEGPYIKGLRRDDQTDSMDEGLKKNHDFFLSTLIIALQKAYK